MVYKLLDNVDDEEQKELRYHRDRSQALENENMALQKRFKELEAKVANSDRAATTMRQSLTQAQQRSTEWERRAKDYESQLEMVQTQLNQTEQTQTQLEVDLSILKVQVEEQEADSRLSNVSFQPSSVPSCIDFLCVRIGRLNWAIKLLPLSLNARFCNLSSKKPSLQGLLASLPRHIGNRRMEEVVVVFPLVPIHGLAPSMDEEIAEGFLHTPLQKNPYSRQYGIRCMLLLP